MTMIEQGQVLTVVTISNVQLTGTVFYVGEDGIGLRKYRSSLVNREYWDWDKEVFIPWTSVLVTERQYR